MMETALSPRAFSTAVPQCTRFVTATVLLLLATLLLYHPPSAFATEESWEPVTSASVHQSRRVYIRGEGYATRNSITVSDPSELTGGALRLVVTSTSHTVTNADGTDDGGNPYFNVGNLDQKIRINFATSRGAFSYQADLYQSVTGETDTDGDGIPDSEDSCPLDPDNDIDGDGICGDVDACPIDPDNDIDGDGICGDVDACPIDPDNDVDGDGICGDVDACPIDPDNDIDGDGICGDVDACPIDPDNDIDGDGICGDVDACPIDPDNDIDGDGICGDVDACPIDPDNDIDGDGICGDVDDCPADPDNDIDGDGICGDEDPCPDDPENTCDVEDICPADNPQCVTIGGLVFGNGASLANALITIGTNTVTTNTDLAGEFSANAGGGELSNDGVDDFFPIDIQADGFASGYTKVALREGVFDYDVEVHLQQVSDTITGDDDLNEGVQIDSGGEPVGALTIPTAALPAGVTEVTGEITYLDPATDDILSIPGGDLLAVPVGSDPNEDTPVTLESFGMMEFDLVDQNGQPISELAGEAEVCMRAPDGLSLGDVVPLWYFDEDTGPVDGRRRGRGSRSQRPADDLRRRHPFHLVELRPADQYPLVHVLRYRA